MSRTGRTPAPFWQTAASWLGLILFALAAAVLVRELRGFRFQDLLASLSALPMPNVALAMLLTVLNYTALTGYDMLGVRFAGRRLPYPRVALTSFIAYAFSHNLGFTALTGPTVRFRFYTRLGLTIPEVIQTALFCALTFWLGFLLLGGATLALGVGEAVVGPVLGGRPGVWVGLGFLSVLAAYAGLNVLVRRRFRWGTIQVALPGLKLTAAQLMLALAEWSLAAGALYALLPPSDQLTYPTLLGLFVVSQVAGMLSQVPGGLGILESILLLLLKPYFPLPSVLSSLLVFRVVYFLLPFGSAALLLGWHEWRERRKSGIRAVEDAGSGV